MFGIIADTARVRCEVNPEVKCSRSLVLFLHLSVESSLCSKTTILFF